MTYLEIINAVLKRLRENTVASVAETTYSALVGELVNDAKRLVEDSWDWLALRDTVTVTTSASTKNYSLTGVPSRGKILDAVNDTQNLRLRIAPIQRLNNYYQLADASEGAPYLFAVAGVDSSDDLSLDLYPTPDGVYSLKFTVIKPQVDLSATSDVLSIPYQPVLQLALAMAARERGETGGTSAAEHFSLADKFLSDAIAMDAGQVPHELIWHSN